jgi:hypothetical protein
MKTYSPGPAALLLALLALPLAAASMAAQTPPAPRVTLSGDSRAGYYSMQRDERDGTVIERDELRARVRIGALLQFSDVLTAKVRAAGRFSTEQESVEFYVRDHAPTVDGLLLGEATIDEAYLNFHVTERVNLRAGRFQSKFVLADLMGKSLDRGDSPNTDITWTDGAHLTLAAARGWNAHLLLQHNGSEGATNAVRRPLDLSSSRSRVTYYGALENSTAWGPVVQRSLAVTLIPGALRVDGEVDDYTAFVARGALAWPVARGRLLLGGEAGYAPNTPARAALQLGDAASGRTGGAAYEIAVTLADAIRGHRFGLAYGEAQAGWLISPDFRNNDRLTEGRYQWQFARSHSFEARVRHRYDLEQPISAERKREDLDFYLRITSRF